LGEVLSEQVEDNSAALLRAGRRLLEKVDVVLISRGRKGAVLVMRQSAWQGRCRGYRKTRSTVGCGDYLLAGFLKGLKEGGGPGSALKTAIKAASARAWGWDERKTWPQVQKRITVGVNRI
ncbi:MAG: PfkB family carbohydrate kinase, partial [Sedimentisphaerales bacterium]|nr:PfkB family carbohydrate kinase [Sedimentisphaerales bacterium]